MKITILTLLACAVSCLAQTNEAVIFERAEIQNGTNFIFMRKVPADYAAALKTVCITNMNIGRPGIDGNFEMLQRRELLDAITKGPKPEVQPRSLRVDGTVTTIEFDVITGTNKEAHLLMFNSRQFLTHRTKRGSEWRNENFR